MAVWSQPNTAEKANKLAYLMQAPIRKEEAMSGLSDLVGDDTLFDFFHLIDPNSDVRCLVLMYLESLMDGPDKSSASWDPQATVICKQIIEHDYR